MPYYPAEAATTHTNYHDNYEDLSHAVVTATFAERCETHGVGIFGALELARLANTVAGMIQSDGAVYRYLDGTGAAGGQVYQLGRFLPLASWATDPDSFVETIRRVLIDIHRIHEPGQLGSTGGLLSLARIIEARATLL